MTSKELAEKISAFLSSKKAEDIIQINVTEKTGVCDYFVIASGRSTTQVKSLAEYVDEEFSKKENRQPLRTEGIREGRWAVIDYGDVLVHLFNDESRVFYHLERLWEDGSNVTRYED